MCSDNSLKSSVLSVAPMARRAIAVMYLKSISAVCRGDWNADSEWWLCK
jgi:hypothetical protein